MTIIVRPYTLADIDAFLTLHRECLAYYKIAPATADQECRITTLLASQRHMACHLAFDHKTPVGFATWGLNFPAGAGISLVMKELFVSSTARGQGVGKALMAALIDVANQEGCIRFDWATDATNTGSQNFYRAINVDQNKKVNYRISAVDFDAFSQKLRDKS